MARELVPIQEINHEGFEVDLKLPEFLAGRIGIDLERLVTLCRIIGVAGLKIRTFKSDEDGGGAVNSVGPQGQATATMVSMSRKPLNDANSKYGNRTPIKPAREYLGEMSLDINEILKIVAARSDLGMRDLEEVAGLLDVELKKAMVKLAVRCSLLDVEKEDVVGTVGFPIAYIYTIANGNVGNLLAILTTHICLNIFGAWLAKKRDQKFRPGVGVFGAEIDRFAWCAIRTHTSKLVGTVIKS